MRKYNATLSYQTKSGSTKSKNLMLTSFEYPMAATITTTQVRRGSVSYNKSAPDQGDLMVSGVCYDVAEYHELAEFIRGWHLNTVSVMDGSFAAMKFIIKPSLEPTHRINFTQYLVAPQSFAYRSSMRDVAPTYTLTLTIVSGKTTKRTDDISSLTGEYLWEWDSGVIDASAPVTPYEIATSQSPEDGFIKRAVDNTLEYFGFGNDERRTGGGTF